MENGDNDEIFLQLCSENIQNVQNITKLEAVKDENAQSIGAVNTNSWQKEQFQLIQLQLQQIKDQVEQVQNQVIILISKNQLCNIRTNGSKVLDSLTFPFETPNSSVEKDSDSTFKLYLTVRNPTISGIKVAEQLWKAYFDELPHHDYISSSFAKWKLESLKTGPLVSLSSKSISVNDAIDKIFDKKLLDNDSWNRPFLNAYYLWCNENLSDENPKAFLMKAAELMGIEIINNFAFSIESFNVSNEYQLIRYNNIPKSQSFSENSETNMSQNIIDEPIQKRGKRTIASLQEDIPTIKSQRPSSKIVKGNKEHNLDNQHVIETNTLEYRFILNGSNEESEEPDILSQERLCEDHANGIVQREEENGTKKDGYSPQEKIDLIRGVNFIGEGKWTMIANCSELCFKITGRRSGSLKDKWRNLKDLGKEGELYFLHDYKAECLRPITIRTAAYPGNVERRDFIYRLSPEARPNRTLNIGAFSGTNIPKSIYWPGRLDNSLPVTESREERNTEGLSLRNQNPIPNNIQNDQSNKNSTDMYQDHKVFGDLILTNPVAPCVQSDPLLVITEETVRNVILKYFNLADTYLIIPKMNLIPRNFVPSFRYSALTKSLSSRFRSAECWRNCFNELLSLNILEMNELRQLRRHY